MFGEHLVREEHHFAADHFQPGFLKSLDDIAAMAIRD
jgi:hypothetical protein